MTRRVAIVGIDGSGKSALVRRLRERSGGAHGDLVTLHCPRYHDTPDAPLALLSQRLKDLSDAADRLRSFELKLAALYLRMTLYGPVERCLADTFAPARLVSDRHPLVDTLTYVPLYRRKVAARLDSVALAPQLGESLALARAWHERECRRLGRDADFDGLAEDIVAAFGRGPEAVVEDFGRRYRTGLPDAVVLLDVDPGEAARRLGGREAGHQELHESEQALAALSATYATVVEEQLPELRPGIEVHRLANAGRPVDDAVDELVALLGSAAAV